MTPPTYDHTPPPPGPYAYTGQYNTKLRIPIPIGENRWFTREEAAEVYRRRGDLEVADAVVRDENGLPHHRWVMGFHPGVRVRFFTPAGSLWRLIDYKYVDGRLFQQKTRTYTYPDDTRRYDQGDSTTMVSTFFKPDGSGSIEINDKSQPTVQRTRFKDADLSTFWMDWPAFEDWDQLANPDFGTPDHPLDFTPDDHRNPTTRQRRPGALRRILRLGRTRTRDE